MANTQIKFGVGFNVDKTGLNQIRTELQQIANMTKGDFLKLNTGGTVKDLAAARRAAEELDQALGKAFNKELGTLNVSKFNQALKNSDKTVDQLYADLSKLGTKGTSAFRNVATQALTTNKQLKQTHNLIDNMAKTMGNTIKWGVASSVMNSFSGSVRKAYGYVKELDGSLNDIRIVTGKSVEQMDQFAEKAAKASKALATSTTDYTEAALIYYQQGLADKEVSARTETTLKAANVTGQSGQKVSEQLTAVWNGYKVSAEETELYVDKLAAVAATTASDLEELSKGMEKVASAANSTGVDIDQLNATLSTVISVTRQAPESVGTAFKTIYARLGDLAVDGEDEFGTKLGEVSTKLKTMGIDILDSQGQMRDMGTVVEEVAAKWSTWTDAQQQAAAVAMAGKRQYNNLIALFENWDMYEKSLSTSANAMGTLQNQQNIYMESTEAHLHVMRASFEDLYDSLLSGDDIETFADAITKVVNGLTTFVDSIGGGTNTLMLLGSVGTKVFSKQIAQGIGTTIQNLQAAKYNASQVQAEFELLEQFKGVPMADKALKDLVKWKGELLGFGKLVSTEQQNEANSIMKTRNELELEVEAWKENEQALDKYLKKAGQKTGLENVKRTPGGGTTEEYDKAYAALSKVKGSVEALKSVYSGAETASKNFDKALIASGGNLDENSADVKELDAHMQRMMNSMKSLNNKNLIPEGQYEKLASTMERISKMDPAERMTVGFKEFKDIFKSVADEVEAENKQMFDLLEKEANGWSGALEREIAECEQRWNNFTKNLKTVQATQQVVNLVSGIGSLATAIQSLMNIKDIINNDDLSAGEKAVQIITALSTALTIGSLGVSTLSGSFVKLTGILGIYTVAQGAADGATKKHTISLFGQKGAADSLGGAFKNLIGKIGGLKLGLIGLGITLAAVGGVMLYKWYTKDARAAEEAAEAAQKASEAARSVQETHQGIIDALDKYDTATEKMNSVTKGTQEWNDALKEANASVLELLDNFPEIATTEGYLERVNGQLKLTEEAIEYIESKSQSMLDIANSSAAIANIESKKATTESDITDFSRNATYTYEKKRNTSEKSKTAGVTQTAYKQGIDRDAVVAALEKIQTEGVSFLAEDAATIAKLIGVTEEQAAALKDNSGELIALSNTIEANKASEDIVYEQVAGSALQENEQYKGLSGEAQGAVNQIVGGQLQTEIDKLLNGAYSYMTDLNREAAESFYGASASRESDTEGVSEYLVDGVWKAYADDVTLMSLATQKATEDIDTMAQGALTAGTYLDGVEVSGEGINSADVKSGILGFAQGETADLSGMNFESMTAMSNMILNLDEKFAEEIGYKAETVDGETKTAIEMFKADVDKAIAEEMTKRKTEIEESIKDESTSENLFNQLNGMSIDEFSTKQRDAVEGLTDKEGNTGTDVLLNSISPETIEEMALKGLNLENVMNEIDWSSMDSSKPTEWFKGAFETAIEDAEYSKENEGDVEGNFATDSEQYGFAEEDYRDLTAYIQENAKASEDYADALATQEDAAQDVAKALLRYDKGVEAVNESGEDWLEMLEEQNDMEIATNIDDIADAYGNVLDMDPSSFSKEFLTSADNMKLMQEAAEGSEEAYNELMEAAQNDILAKVGLDRSEFDADVAELNAMNASGDLGLDDLEIGASIDDSQYLAKLEEMINASDMTAQQASDLLASMGIDAEIEEHAAEATENNESELAIPKLDGFKTVAKLPILGEVRIPSISWEKIADSATGKKEFKGHSLKIKSAKKSSGGNFKFKNSKHGGGTGGKKSSGGSSSSTPSKSYKTTETKKDPFHDVNNDLSQLEKKFDKLADAQDRLYGKKALDNLNAQLKVLKDQVKVTKDKLKIAQDEVKEMRKSKKNQRKGYFNDLSDFGIKFDENGEIENYEKVLDTWDQKVEKLHNKWNAMTAEEQESDEGKALEKKIEKAETNRDTLVDLVEEYEDYIYDMIPELKSDIQQKASAMIEIEITKFKLEGQLYLDMSEALEHLAEFKTKMIETMTFDELGIGYTDTKATKSDGSTLKKLTRDENGEIVESENDQYVDLALGGGSLLAQARQSRRTSAVNLEQIFGYKTNEKGEFIDENGEVTTDPAQAAKNQSYMLKEGSNVIWEKTQELNGLTGAWEDYRNNPTAFAKTEMGKQFVKEGIFDEQAFKDAITASRDELEAEIEKVDQAYADNREALLNTIDLISEAFSLQMETYDFINDRIETQIEAAKILNKPTGEDATENAGFNKYEGLNDLYANASANAQAKADTAQQAMNLYLDKMNNAQTGEEREKWQELYKQSVEDYENASREAIEAYRKENENHVRAQAEAAFGTEAQLDLEDAQWEIAQKKDDKYLDEIDKAYEVQKLSRKLQEDMDGASLSAQAKLAKFRDEELEKLKEKDKLTQYDVDRANKLYEIELKKIALEEAQQNKSKMRLRRDSSGNYSYQFTADEEGQAKAQQELEDAQFGLREMDLEQEKKLQEEMLQMRREYKEKWIEYNLLSDEEKKMREAEYQAWFGYYNEELSNTAVQALDVQNNAANSSLELKRTIYSQDKTAFGQLTSEEITALESVDTRFHELTKSQQDALTAEGGLYPTWMSSVDTLAKSFGAKVDEMGNAYYSDADNSFKTQVNDANGEVQTKQDELNGKISAAATAMTTAAGTAKTQATDVWLPAQQAVTGELQTELTVLESINAALLEQKGYWDGIKQSASEAITATDIFLADTAEEDGKKIDTNGGEEPTTTKKNSTTTKKNNSTTTKKNNSTTTKKNPTTTKKNNSTTTKKNPTTTKKELKEGSVITYSGKYYTDSFGGGPSGSIGAGKKNAVKIDMIVDDPAKGQTYAYHIKGAGEYSDYTDLGWIKKSQISGYDTGGYTGKHWTSNKKEGKLALLHEKELVLNAKDTENMLEMLRLTKELYNQKDLLKSKDKSSNKLQEDIEELRKSYKEKWLEYNSLSDKDRQLKEEKYAEIFEKYENKLKDLSNSKDRDREIVYSDLKAEFAKLNGAKDEEKAAKEAQLQAYAQMLEKEELSLQNAKDVAKNLQEIAKKKDNILNKEDIQISFSNALSPWGAQNDALRAELQTMNNGQISLGELLHQSIINSTLDVNKILLDSTSSIMQAIMAKKSEPAQQPQQNVHIQAEFPNVRVADEIKEAMANLTNTASQRIGQGNRARKNPSRR